MRCVFYSLVLLSSLGAFHAQSQTTTPNYGLSFSSHEVSKDHRTGLDLNPEDDYSVQKDFTIKFELSLQRLTNAYGYILRIIANDSTNIDLMSTPEHEEFRDLSLIINNKPTELQFDYSEIGIAPLQWTSLSISFSYKENKITLRWNDREKDYPMPLSDLRRFRFYFGANNFGKFNTTDVPPVIIRNVSLTENGKLVRKWLLKKHNINEVYDSVANATATVRNPTWLIDRTTRWAHRKDVTVNRFPSVAFNGDSAILYITDDKNIYSYELAPDKLRSKKLRSGKPVYTDANQLLYVKEQGQLVNYDLSTGKLQAYHFDTNSWENTDTLYNEPNYWHNNKFYNPIDRTIYTFGGYGHFTYKNAFHRFNLNNQKWERVETSGEIPPRYLSASGLRQSTNEILIFGGYGSLSGKQELSPQSFYDLYSFNLKTHAVQKVREYTPAEVTEDIVFSNSLIVNEAERCFYALSFPKNKYEGLVQLRQYSLDASESKVLADSIPFHFHDEDSFCDLFYSETTGELIAVTAHQDKKNYQVSVHSISYPPLQLQDVLQPGKPAASTKPASILAIVVAALGVVGLVYYFWKKKKDIIVTPIPLPETSPAAQATTRFFVDDHKVVSSVFLFGGFQVFDKSGTDITGKFTMTLKELFALILIHSIKFEKGISTSVIQDYLWPDKDEVSARNNRNVNIKKLRTLLDEVGKISIENNNSYLRLTMEDQVFCDYQIVHRLLDPANSHVLPEGEKITTIIRNVKRGSLLPNLQNEWLDNFKSDISNRIIDTLLEYSQKLDANKDDKLLIEIADTIFAYDSINQEALVIKCSVLNKKGKYSLAKNWYDHFVKEYKNLYSENYPRTFDEVIS